MARNDYIKAGDAAFRDQLQVFKAAAPAYATVLGLSAATLTAQAADADYFAYVVTSQRVLTNSAQQWTVWRELIRVGGTPPPAGAAVEPTMPAAVPAVDPGVEARIRALVAQIKAHPNYTDTQTPPATLTKWKYRAIYRADDRRVGQWSAEVEVTVGG